MKPTCPSQSRKCGLGSIETQLLGSTSQVSVLSFNSPLRLLAPTSQRGESAAMVFMLNHGGGLVSGDRVSIQVQVGPGSRLGLLTQGSTKIYKCVPGVRATSQSLNVTIAADAALLVLPDPVQPFNDSVCRQIQHFDIDAQSSSLLLLDWISEGRSALDEKWNLAEWQGRNEIWSSATCNNATDPTKNVLLLRDNMKLVNESPQFMQSMEERMGRFGVLGSIIIRGPLFKNLGDSFLRLYAELPRIGNKQWSTRADTTTSDALDECDMQRCGECLVTWTASSARGFVVVRFGAPKVELARQWLRRILTDEGTVAKEFGGRYLFCLQDH